MSAVIGRDHVDLIRAAVRTTGSARVPVSGISMLPAIEPGTQVIIRAAGFEEVRPGDIVAFKHDDGVVVHRVADVWAGRLLTAGDNLPLYDPLLEPERFIGVVAGPQGPCRPSPAQPVSGPPGPCEITVWMVGAAAKSARMWHHLTALPAGVVRVAVRQIDLTDHHRLAAFVSMLRGVRVGLSPEAINTVGRLTELVSVAEQLNVLIGCRFGIASGGPVPVLPPNCVDEHVRAADPLADLPAVEALAAALGAIVPAVTARGA